MAALLQPLKENVSETHFAALLQFVISDEGYYSKNERRINNQDAIYVMEATCFSSCFLHIPVQSLDTFFSETENHRARS